MIYFYLIKGGIKKIKIIGVVLIVLLLIIPIGYYEANNATKKDEPLEIIQDNYIPLDGGWIKEIDGVTVLYLSGTPYEMGYQHGYFQKDEIHANMRMMSKLFEDYGFSHDVLVESWDTMKEYVPETGILEVQGLADGCNTSLEEIGAFTIWHDIVNLLSCCGVILWNTATTDGELIHVRSGDLKMNIKDPTSGTYLQENQILIVRNPDNGYASMSPMLSGGIGSYGGINEKGIAVSETTCPTDDTTLFGIPASFRMGMVLDYADSGLDAIDIMNNNRTCGWSLFISDANIPKGYVVEQTATMSHVFTWDDPIESTRPFYQIKNVLRRTNCFISPTLAETEREHYNPRGLSGFFRFIFKNDPYFFVWQHYKALSKGIKKYYGSLDLDSSMKMLREVYSGKTNLIFRYFQNRGGQEDIQQWVANPKTGDFLVSFASIEKCAHETKIHHFNLFDFLDSNQN